MYIKNRAVALLFRVMLIIGCAYGLAELSGFLRGGYTNKMLAYYTNISNILVLIFTLVTAAHTLIGLARYGLHGDCQFIPKIKRAFVLMITVTVLVYHFVLAPVYYSMSLSYSVYGLPDILVHYFTPIMFILDWLLFDKKNQIRWHEPLLWLLLPLAYLMYILIRAEVAEPLYAAGGRYPYPFLDLDILGFGTVAGNVLLCLAAFTVLGYIFFAIDKLPRISAITPDKNIDA